MAKIIIIGGGVIGATTAYYLQKKGHTVTIVDRGGFGQACSKGNCGYICPSHVLPLTTPEAIKTGLKSMFNKSSPFYIKPRLSYALFSWLFHFARRCNRRDMMQAGHEIQTLLGSSRQLYDDLFATEAFDCEWEKKGLLFVFQSESAFRHYEQTNALLSENFAMPAKPFDGTALAKLEPTLKPGLAGGWLYENDGHLRPEKLMASWRSILTARSASIVENCDVTGFTKNAAAITTSQGEMAADSFIVAAGALTPFLNKELGCRIPIQPGKGYSITMPKPTKCPSIPIIFEEHHVAVTPFQAGYRIGSTMEFAGYDSSLNRDRLNYLRKAASHYLDEPATDVAAEEWFGWRPMTYDSKPIIDRSPKYKNVWIAAGHNMLGVSMAPATGKALAELMTDETPHVDLKPFGVARFS